MSDPTERMLNPKLTVTGTCADCEGRGWVFDYHAGCKVCGEQFTADQVKSFRAYSTIPCGHEWSNFWERDNEPCPECDGGTISREVSLDQLFDVMEKIKIDRELPF